MRCKYVENDELYKATEEALKFLDNQEIVTRENQDRIDKVKECEMIIHVNDVSNPKISKAMPGYYNDLVDYVLELVYGLKDFEMSYQRDDDAGWSYTYHELFSKYLKPCVEELKRNKITRRAVLPVAGDRSYKTDDPPCLQWIGFQICDDKLDTTCLFRSNDAVGAFTMNSFGIIELARLISKELGINLGSYTHHAANFHVYQRDFEKLSKYIYLFDKKEQYYSYEEYLKRFEKDAPKIIENSKNREQDLLNQKYDKFNDKVLVRKKLF